MIKNIIFDMGGVLIDYAPEKTAYKYFDKETAEIALKVIFRNQLWSDRDRGIINSDEIMDLIRDKIPSHALEQIDKMVHNYYPYMPPFEKMYDVVKALKDNGYGIYLLSNAARDFYENKKDIPALSLFDGYLISADYKLLKPEKEIYQALFERFDLKPEECYFIDDVQKNIDGAKAAGMDGHCYYHGDVEILKKALREAGIKI